MLVKKIIIGFLFFSLIAIPFLEVRAIPPGVGVIGDSATQPYQCIGRGNATSFTWTEVLAAVRGIDSAYLEYGFAVVLTIAILVSLKMMGALLVEALVVVPAAAARNVARGTRAYLVWSVIVAFAAGAGGLAISTRLLVPTGGAVVLAASLIFFVTLAIGTVRRQA